MEALEALNVKSSPPLINWQLAAVATTVKPAAAMRLRSLALAIQKLARTTTPVGVNRRGTPWTVRCTIVVPVASSRSTRSASYWTVRVGNRSAENAVWGYDDPFPEVTGLEAYVAFYPDRVEIEIDS